jgi:hypothetical protein
MGWVLLSLLVAPRTGPQVDTTLLRRWVGNHLERPLTLEFYGETMLVVGDRLALNFRLTPVSIIAEGDTSFTVRYRMAFGRLLLETQAGDVITMSTQNTLGRPITGRWVGDLDTAGATQLAEVVLDPDRSAHWHGIPDGRRSSGEWERETRVVTLTWEDGSEWTGLYDPQRNTLLLEPVADSTGVVRRGKATGVLRRMFR